MAQSHKQRVRAINPASRYNRTIDARRLHKAMHFGERYSTGMTTFGEHYKGRGLLQTTSYKALPLTADEATQKATKRSEAAIKAAATRARNKAAKQ